MKKTLLALAIATIATSASAAEVYKSDDGKVDFYGQLRQELRFENKNDHKADLSSGSSRAGVNASYAVSDSVDLLGTFEIGVGDSEVNNRLHFIGFGTDLGTVTFGKQYNATDDVWGAEYSYFYGGSALLGERLNGGKHDSSVKYTFDGENFWVKGTYGLNEGDNNDANAKAGEKNNLDMYDLFVGTSIGDLSLHAGGGYTNDNKVNFDNELSQTYGEFTAEYTLGDLLFGGTYYYSQLKNESGAGKIDENGITVSGLYDITEKLAAYAQYEYVTQDATDVMVNNQTFNGDEDGTLIVLGGVYKFNSWARVYAEYAYGDGTTLGYKSASDSVVERTVADGESNFAVGARVYW